MKPEVLFVVVPLALVAVIFQIMPLLTRRGIFFSATVDADFPSSPAGRRLLRAYRLQVALWTVLAFGLLALLLPSRLEYALLAPMILLLLGAGVSYWLKFREIHQAFGVRRPEVREANLAGAEREQIRPLVVIPPFLAIAAVAFYLFTQWNRLPARFPVHWDINGQPNGWASRDFVGVYGTLIMAVFMNLFLLGLAWAFRRMARKSMMRYVTVRVLEVMLYPLTFSLLTVALLPLVRTPLWLGPAVMLTFVAGIFYWSFRKITAPSTPDEVPEPQSDSYWKAGVFYYNPNDPAIFVAKRVGIGYTINFANKMSWVVMGVILLIVLLPAFLRK